MLLPRLLFSLFAAVHEPAPVDGDSVMWSAPPECPDREALRGALVRRLGRPLGPGEARVDARVVGSVRAGYTLRLALAVGEREETRALKDPSCAALADAVALRVVVMLESAPVVPPPLPAGEVDEPGAGDMSSGTVDANVPKDMSSGPVAVTPQLTVPRDMSSGPAAAAPQTPDPKDMSTDAPAGPPPPPTPPPRTPGGFVRLAGGPELGALPGPTGAVDLAVGLLWPRVRVELHGTVLAPRTAGRPPGEVRAGLYAGSVRGCGRLGRGAVEVPLCLGVEVGALRGAVTGLPGGRAAAAWWAAAVLGPAVVWRVSRWLGVWAGLSLVLAPVRPRFEQGAGASALGIFTPSAVSGRLVLGLEIRFGDRR